MTEHASRVDIADNNAPDVEARLTSFDIARMAGVSVSAVSLALNGRPGVSETTRQRIVAIADEMNWRPHRAARALKGATNDVAGLVVARPARTLGIEPFFAHLMSGLQSTLSQSSFALQLLIVEDTASEIATYRQWAAENRVAGTVLLDLAVDDPRPAVLADLGIPAVAIGGAGEAWPVTSVWADDYAAMTTLLSYLSALGHRNLGYVGGTATYEHTRRRAAAVAELSKTQGLRVTTISTDFSDEQGGEATRSLLSRFDRPTALVYDSDVMAVAGLGVANEMGVEVPLAALDRLIRRLGPDALDASGDHESHPRHLRARIARGRTAARRDHGRAGDSGIRSGANAAAGRARQHGTSPQHRALRPRVAGRVGVAAIDQFCPSAFVSRTGPASPAATRHPMDRMPPAEFGHELPLVLGNPISRPSKAVNEACSIGCPHAHPCRGR
ncbi:DNA-binding LacI/PurR family transcriptional regulator [Microbacterium murale]|uniref:DNA-binding LacI/PurR family transcriptional regulator n=1 Tax=Microbacterium murale TaxID=1081040 RepID=A0ABU0PA06_9MICO|nr:DNA-binding LacI/PurR family transcriptional regulator [Microbacterium murale]